MSRFSPFDGLRYDRSIALAEVTAPPYDVLDDSQRASLAGRHRANVVHVDLPIADDGGDRYQTAAAVLAEWIDSGTLVRESTPVFYGYRMSFTDPAGRARRTTGVLGALALSRPGEGDILPHEHTTPKAKSDRLDLLRATRTNLSPIWGLSPSGELTAAIGEPSEDAERFTDDEGVSHLFWVIDDPDRKRAITAAVESAPVVIADGHHRYETSLQYRDERRGERADGDAGGAEAAMVLVVELVTEELTVLPIHRLLTGLAPGTDLAGALTESFEVAGTPIEPSPALLDRMVEEGFLVLVERDALRALRPRPGVFDGLVDLDTVRLDVALRAAPDHELSYQHGVDNVIEAVRSGRADAGILVRPATVDQIRATADGGERMPPKTTFFHPKPKTGLVLRSTD